MGKKSDQKAGTEPFNMGAFRVMMAEAEMSPRKEGDVPHSLEILCLFLVSKGLSSLLFYCDKTP